MTKASPAKSQPSIDTQTWVRAVEEGDTPLVKSLLAAGADVNAVSEGGKTVLMRAAARGYLDVVQVLLDAGAEVNAKKENGSTALILAVFFGHTGIVRALLAKGADPNTQTPQGTPAVEWAQFIGFTEIVELLRNAEATRAGNATQENTANSEQVSAPELFPVNGTFLPVVPLSEIEESTPPPSVEAAPVDKVSVAVVEERQADEAESVMPEQSGYEEVTLVPQRARATSRFHPSSIVRTTRALRFWPVTVSALVLLLIVGLILDAQWKTLRQSAKVEHSVPPATEASTATDDKTVSVAPEPAPPVPPAPEVTESSDVPSATATDSSAPDEKNLKAVRDDEAQRVSSSPSNSLISEGQRAPDASPTARRVATSAAAGRSAAVSAGSEKEAAAVTKTTRRDARIESRAQRAEGRVQTSTSPALSLPVSAPPPAKSEQKKVIQWP